MNKKISDYYIQSYVPKEKSSLKKKLKILSLWGLGIGSAFWGSQVAINKIFKEKNSTVVDIQEGKIDYQSLITQTTDEEDKNTLLQLIKWAEEIPSGRNVLNALKKHKTQLFMLNLVGDEYGVSFPDLSGVCLNSALLNQDENRYLAFAAFIHEAEHIRVMGLSHQNGIGLTSFQSLDDQYIFGTINESLAVRKSVQAVQELIKKHPDWPYAKKWQDLLNREYATKGNLKHIADLAFEKRMENLTGLGASLHYETHIPQIKEEIQNQRKFPKNPDWNQIIKMITDNEVKSVSVFPVPSFYMARSMIFNEMAKQEENIGNYTPKLKDLDLSCIIKNKASMLKKGDFCDCICRDIAYMAEEIYQYHKNDKDIKEWFSELQKLMPKKQIEKIKSPNKNNLKWNDKELNDFLSKQDNFEYLKKAQKLLSSDKLKVVTSSEAAYFYLRQRQNLFKIYDELFFENENRQLISRKRSSENH